MKKILSSTFFFGAILFGLVSLAPSQTSAQQKVFEVFGNDDDEFLGTSLVCRNPGIHVGVPGVPQSSFTSVGEVRVFDPANQNLLYTIGYPITPSNQVSFGSSMIAVPDSNGNFIREIAIGAPGGFSGAVFLFDEGIAGSSAPVRSLFTSDPGDAYGTSLALLDYPPRDGTPELFISAPQRTPSSGGVGEVDVRNITTGNIIDKIPAPNANYDAFGKSISRIEDLDGNGSDDIVIGAPSSFGERGAALIFSLTGAGSGPTFQLIREIQGDTPSEGFADQVAGIPDITGDGKQDLLVSAPQAGAGKGVVRVYSGADLVAPNTLNPICVIFGTTDGDLMGSAIAGLGDVDEDGKGEFAVSMTGFGGSVGRVDVYQFTSGVGCQLLRSYTGSTNNDRIGRTVVAEACPAIAPKVTSLMVGTSSQQNGIDAGSAVIYAPPPTVTPTPTPTVTVTPLFTPTPTPKPSKATLTFRISEAGEFKINTKYDIEPDGNCSSILYGRVKVGTAVLPLEKLVSNSNSTGNTNERDTTIRILNFPKAAKVDGQKPFITMALRTTCDGETFDSNVFARYMNCGVPDTAVSVDQWITTLKRALERAGEQTSIRSDRTVKVVRLKKRRRR